MCKLGSYLKIVLNERWRSMRIQNNRNNNLYALQVIRSNIYYKVNQKGQSGWLMAMIWPSFSRDLGCRTFCPRSSGTESNWMAEEQCHLRRSSSSTVSNGKTSIPCRIFPVFKVDYYRYIITYSENNMKIEIFTWMIWYELDIMAINMFKRTMMLISE